MDIRLVRFVKAVAARVNVRFEKLVFDPPVHDLDALQLKGDWEMLLTPILSDAVDKALRGRNPNNIKDLLCAEVPDIPALEEVVRDVATIVRVRLGSQLSGAEAHAQRRADFRRWLMVERAMRSSGGPAASTVW